ncbi:hypothetical protein [Pyrococcus yayanosii]|uniref:KaiC-like domain-containing protein n=1 Tax=Pyrococcus yayanosii (strain CH1 / JCM 16557) TaxID=529709 RepID=F8AGX6_PYRYC|nr:hypothetical protein [Pyrococcus yayanosii]AEH25271.1 hypothetical protein PYCH_16050 [Pyrococcus yayanosii CH1]
MVKFEQLIREIPHNGVLSIIQRDLESNGDLYSLSFLKHLLEAGEKVFVLLYEPFHVFLGNAKMMGIDVEGHLGKELVIFDVFASVNHLERNIPGVYTLSGYLDDVVFVTKLKELGREVLESEMPESLWIFTYTTSGMCKLFSNPLLTYKMIWAMREELLTGLLRVNTIVMFSPIECPDIEDMIYFVSDVIIETMILKGRRVGIITKGPYEGEIFELFGGE